jgi:hypothetical protein
MKFKANQQYIQKFTDGIKRWTVTKRTAKTVTVTGEKWLGEIYTKRINVDSSGAESIRFTKRYTGTLSAQDTK